MQTEPFSSNVNGVTFMTIQVDLRMMIVDSLVLMSDESHTLNV